MQILICQLAQCSELNLTVKNFPLFIGNRFSSFFKIFHSMETSVMCKVISLILIYIHNWKLYYHCCMLHELGMRKKETMSWYRKRFYLSLRRELKFHFVFTKIPLNNSDCITIQASEEKHKGCEWKCWWSRIC